MDKAIISTPLKRKTINYFKYEMQDTNQLLKDLVWYKMSQTLQASRSNNSQKLYHDMFREDVCITKSDIQTDSHSRKRVFQGRVNEASYFERIGSEDIKLQDQIQNQQNPIMTEFLPANQNSLKRKKTDKLSQNEDDIGDLIECNLSADQSQGQTKQKDNIYSLDKQKNRIIQPFSIQKISSLKQSKKQKKGLANISLRVKNIVAQHKQLTYAEVTNLVIQHSKDELNRLQPNARTKQMKNIKRRVYDALNVLVALQVLKKKSKYVTATDWTNVPGKVHSSQWQKVTQKLDYIKNMKKDCHQKQIVLTSLLQKYYTLTALHNKHRIQSLSESQKKQSGQIDKDTKLEFPVLMFCPVFQDEISVSLKEGEDKNLEVKVSGNNLAVFGDFDLALDTQKQSEILHEIQQKCQRTQIFQKGQKTQKTSSVKVSQGLNTHIDDIDNFFDENMFDKVY